MGGVGLFVLGPLRENVHKDGISVRFGGFERTLVKNTNAVEARRTSHRVQRNQVLLLKVRPPPCARASTRKSATKKAPRGSRRCSN